MLLYFVSLKFLILNKTIDFIIKINYSIIIYTFDNNLYYLIIYFYFYIKQITFIYNDRKNYHF